MKETDYEAQFDYSHEQALEPPTEPDVLQVVKDLADMLQYATEALNALIVVQMRNYDVNMSLLEAVDPVEAKIIHEKHKNGGVFSPEIIVPGDQDEVE